MSEPYIEYETSTANKICVSIRADNKVNLADYYHYLGKFIDINANNILLIGKPTKFICGSFCTIIQLKELLTGSFIFH